MVRSSAARRRRGAVAARGGGSAGRWRLPLCPRWRRAANGAALPRVGPWLCCGPGLRPCPHIIIPDSRRRRYGAGQLAQAPAAAGQQAAKDSARVGAHGIAAGLPLVRRVSPDGGAGSGPPGF